MTDTVLVFLPTSLRQLNQTCSDHNNVPELKAL